MRFIVDAQLPSALCRWFQERGHAAVYGPDVLGSGRSDQAIADYAVDQGLIVVSKDRDFVVLQARYGNRL